VADWARTFLSLDLRCRSRSLPCAGRQFLLLSTSVRGTSLSACRLAAPARTTPWRGTILPPYKPGGGDLALGRGRTVCMLTRARRRNSSLSSCRCELQACLCRHCVARQVVICCSLPCNCVSGHIDAQDTIQNQISGGSTGIGLSFLKSKP
jgi:hypothetical protein